MDHSDDNRAQIRDFLTSRRARITPEQAGMAASSRRRVPGLRREEVAVLAGVSTEWYTRLEKGHIAGVSEDVLDAVARALRLDTDERTYLFDLARAARPARHAPARRKEVEAPPRVEWLLDSMTLSAAYVRDGRMDVIASNALARALFAPLFESPATKERGRANIARFIFLDPAARDFYVDWDRAAVVTAALLRAQAGREPHDPVLRELIGELSTMSAVFRTHWAAHDVLIHHHGTKELRHPAIGDVELTYQSVDLRLSDRGTPHDMTFYTAEPGTPDEERLRLLASWGAPGGGEGAAGSPGKATASPGA